MKIFFFQEASDRLKYLQDEIILLENHEKMLDQHKTVRKQKTNEKEVVFQKFIVESTRRSRVLILRVSRVCNRCYYQSKSFFGLDATRTRTFKYRLGSGYRRLEIVSEN